MFVESSIIDHLYKQMIRYCPSLSIVIQEIIH